jgi:hypothetical protein
LGVWCFSCNHQSIRVSYPFGALAIILSHASTSCQVTLAKGIQALGGTLFLGPGRREGIVRGVVGHVLLGAPHYCLHITDKVWAEP